MKIRFKDKIYESIYDAKTNTVGVTNPDEEILKILEDERLQRGLLMGELLNNPFYDLNEAIKNPLL